MQWIISLWLATVCTVGPTQDLKKDALFAALCMPGLLQIMRVERPDYGADIGGQVFGDRPNPDWDSVVSAIYADDFMTQDIRAAFDEELQACDLDAILAFFTSHPRQTIISLKISARQAMLDSSVNTASKLAAAFACKKNAPRIDMIRQIIAANQLIDSNVAGALATSGRRTLTSGTLPRIGLTPI